MSHVSRDKEGKGMCIENKMSGSTLGMKTMPLVRANGCQIASIAQTRHLLSGTRGLINVVTSGVLPGLKCIHIMISPQGY